MISPISVSPVSRTYCSAFNAVVVIKSAHVDSSMPYQAQDSICTFVSNYNICECSIVFCVSECVQERKKVTGKKNYRDDTQEITF